MGKGKNHQSTLHFSSRWGTKGAKTVCHYTPSMTGKKSPFPVLIKSRHLREVSGQRGKAWSRTLVKGENSPNAKNPLRKEEGKGGGKSHMVIQAASQREEKRPTTLLRRCQGEKEKACMTLAPIAKGKKGVPRPLSAEIADTNKERKRGERDGRSQSFWRRDRKGKETMSQASAFH